jgi:hypothetical protein
VLCFKNWFAVARCTINFLASVVGGRHELAGYSLGAFGYFVGMNGKMIGGAMLFSYFFLLLIHLRILAQYFIKRKSRGKEF